ncbi:hypothetical protein NDI52_30070 [Leptolyngbya sp. PL-A3]
MGLTILLNVMICYFITLNHYQKLAIAPTPLTSEGCSNDKAPVATAMGFCVVCG